MFTRGVTISPETKREIELQLGRSGIIVSLFHIGAFVCLWGLTNYFNEQPVVGMAALVILVSICFLRLIIYYRRKSDSWRGPFSWLTVFRGITVIAAGTWSMCCEELVRTSGLGPTTQLFFLCIFVVAAAATFSFSVDGRLMHWMLALLILPQIVSLTVFVSGRVAAPHVAIFSLFWMFCVFSGKRTNNAFWDSVRHREATRRQRDQLHAVLEAIPGSVGWLDATGRYVGANRHFAGLFHLHPEDFIGRKAGTISGGSEYGDAIQSFIDSGIAQDLREVQIPIDNVNRCFLVALKKYGDMTHPQYLMVAIDIDDQKRIERELDAAMVKSHESSRLTALGVMASGVAHEINNPLAILRGRLEQLIEVIEQPSIDVAYATELARKSEKVIDRIAKITRGLQALSQDTSQMAFESTSVSSIFDSIAEIVTARFRSSGVRLEFLSPALELSVTCRSTQVAQVVLNLMNNSFDAVESLSERWVRVEAVDKGEFVQILVTDSGRGVSSEVEKRMFDPFFTTKPVGKGTGLGLSTSRSIAEAHGGKLDYEFVGGRTRFVLTLPKERVAASSCAYPA
jgi:signal transduction histidine kinase